MDEEENQEELVNRWVSLGKGPRKSSLLTDEEDGAGAGGSGSEESVGRRGAEDAEEDRDEEDSDGCLEEEGGALKGVDRAAGRASALLQDVSSDDDAEKCPICLHSLQEQPLATPSGCQHHFCLDCILEWSKNVNSCPVDRIAFNSIQLRKCFGGKVQKAIPVQEPVKVEEISVDFDQTSCEVCGRSDREDRLLLCDGCDAGYHIECLTPPLDAVPVEEWFCPECTSNNPQADSAEEVSEEEVAALLSDAVPTTSRLRTATAGRTRSIARTRQSERVRETVNRNRITQAHAVQHVPRYLIQSTWLDETINAVLNSSACARRGRTGEKHRKTKKKKASTESSSSSSSKSRTARKEIKLHRGQLKGSKPEKQAAKKDHAPHSRIAKSSAAGKPKQSTPPRPLAGHPKIGPASLSVYGDPLDLDPFDDESSEEGSLSMMDMSRRGLSHSALRSHQPMARPVQHGISRCNISISEGEMVEDSAPVPDLLGSILSGQSLLLMDSSTMVVNRDGSLKLGNPVCASSSKTNITGHTNTSESETKVHAEIASGSEPCRDAEPSHSLPPLPSSSHGFPGPSSPPAKIMSPLTCSIMPGNANAWSPNLAHEKLHTVCAALPVNPFGLGQRSKTSASGPSLGVRHSNDKSDWSSRDKGVDTGMGTGTVKNAPLKPVWLDVSRLPRIPKIRRVAESRTGQQGVLLDEQGRAEPHRRQKQDRAGPSCTSTSSSSLPSADNFCISALRQTSCAASPEGHVTSLGSAENLPSATQIWNIRDRFHPMSSQLLGSEDATKGSPLDHHANAVMPKEKGMVPCISGCNYDNADNQTKLGITAAIKERNKYSGYGESIKKCSEKCKSCNLLSSQKLDSSLHSEKNKSGARDQCSRSSSRSATRGKTDCDGKSKLKDCNSRSGSTDSTETKKMSKEVTGYCSRSKERKGAWSSSESSVSESPERLRRRRRCSQSRSPRKWSHSFSGHRSRTRKRDHEWLNRKGSENQGFCHPRLRSTSRSRSRDRRKDSVRSQFSCRSKDWSRSKDGKRPRSRSQSKERKNEEIASHSSRSAESSWRMNGPSSTSPTGMENNHIPVCLKYPEDLTGHKEMQRSEQFSPSDVSKLQKLKTEKNASLSGVNEEISAFVFHCKEGQSQGESKEKENKERSEKNILEKMADTKLIWVQSHVKPSRRTQISSSVKTEPISGILPVRKHEHFCKVTDRAGSISSEKLFVAKEEKGMKHELPDSDQNKPARETPAECTAHLSVDYTLTCLRVKSPDKAETSGAAGDKQRTMNTSTSETVCEMEASMITYTSETVGDMDGAVITDAPETAGDTEVATITDTLETVGDMENTVITDTSGTAGDTEVAMITDTLETVGDMENTVITDTRGTAGDMKTTVIIGTQSETVADDEGAMVADTPGTVGNMEGTVITDSSETVGNTKTTGITGSSETVGNMEGTVITDSSETVGDIESTVIADTPETIGDLGSTVITDIPKNESSMQYAKIMDRAVVKQEAQQALKPAVATAFSSTISKRPVKRVSWSLQELDVPPAQPTRTLPPNALQQSLMGGLPTPASSSQDMTKFNLQERAIEEVKLAIRPFFQKKEITKDEYREIWGKAVQKICRSKSGEISPERVASLVKAYVEKYKFLKKQQKDRRSQELEGTL